MSSVHIHVCIKCAYVNRCSPKYAHKCMHQLCIYKSQLCQVCTHIHASTVHISTAVIASMYIHDIVCINHAQIMHMPSAVMSSMLMHVCIEYVFANRSYCNCAHTCMCQFVAYTSASLQCYLHHAHTRMHRVIIPLRFLQVRTYMYASSMHQVCT